MGTFLRPEPALRTCFYAEERSRGSGVHFDLMESGCCVFCERSLLRAADVYLENKHALYLRLMHDKPAS